MRLHRLEVERFGPFADRVRVDVDAVSDHGLFLLHGSTGAGKTSLLDAVCFALYGSVPGPRSKSERLTCDHPGTTGTPEVVCEFSAAGRRFEVTRSPAWARPKSRGTGTTPQPAKVTVRELVDGVWSARTSRIDEAGLLIADVLGMAKDQFTKVVLLPQGDFAAFLRASADDRKALLQKLFGTARFSDVEAWLAERRSSAKLAVSELDQARQRLLARVDEHAQLLRGYDHAAAVDIAEAIGARADDDAARHATRMAAAAVAELAGEREHHQSALAAAESQRVAVTAAHRVVERMVDLEGMLVEHQRLRAEAQTVSDGRRRLERATLAERVRVRLDAVLEARVRLDHAREELTRARTDLDSAVTLSAVTLSDSPARDPIDVEVIGPTQLEFELTPDQPLQRLHTTDGVDSSHREADGNTLVQRITCEIEVRQRTLGVLADLAEAEDQLHRQVAEQQSAADRVARLTETLGVVQARIGDRTDELARAHEARARCAAAAAGLVGAGELLEQAVTRRDAAKRLAQLGPVLSAATQHHDEARRAALDARQGYLDLLQARLEGIAGELAARLTDGDPCPVCGAAEHPNPAEAARVVEQGAVEQARSQAEQADRQVEQAAERLNRLTTEVAEARTAAAGLTVDQAIAAHQHAADALSAINSAATDLTTMQARIDELVADADADAALATQLTGEHDEAEAARAQVASAIEVTRRRVQAGLAGEASIEGRRRRLREEIRLLTAADQAQRAFAEAGSLAGSAHRAAARDCERLGFVDVDDAFSALLDDAVLTQLTSRIAKHDAAMTAVITRLAADDLAAALADLGLPTALTATDAVDLGHVHTQLRVARQRLQLVAEQAGAAETRLSEAGSRVGLLESCSQALAELAAQLSAHAHQAGPAREHLQVLDELTGTCHGLSPSNTKKLRLSAYVLQARLEQVALAASDRLLSMSQGRYTLVSTDSREKGSARAGLGLRIMDAWTSRERDTASLSGGESFLASLSLALGLADVVQAESGGVSIDTLFIDEGFGSLDDDTLELVMDCLDQLREGGRAVGVVSHVSELRSRIPTRLHVVKGQRGSTVRPERAAAS